MRARVAGLLIAALGLLFIPGRGSAGERPGLELGLDGGLVVSSIDDVHDNVTQLAFPFQRFRIGVMPSETAGIESAVSLNYLDAGSSTITTYGLGFSLILNLVTGQSSAIPFVRAGWTFEAFDTNLTDSMIQYGLGWGLGVKIPAMEQLAIRMELAASRFIENDDFRARWDFAGLFGISLLTIGGEK